MANQLISRIKEVTVNDDAPFDGDVLERKANAEILTSIIDTYCHSGCVLAINGEWGSGKTTFVKMWNAHLHTLGYHTLFFDAWKFDYLDDPLVAIISELKSISPDNEHLSKAISNIGRIILTGFTSGIKSLIKTKSIIAGEILDKLNDVGDESLKAYSEQKQAFEDFRLNLESFVADSAKDKPVVFFIDELDRCKPDFAVRVLERIKHLFDIPNIVFVLSMNKTQLGRAIQGYYGAPNMDWNDYLRRFIDHEYHLPTPNPKAFVKYLYDNYRFGDFLESSLRKYYFHNEKEQDQLLETATVFTIVCGLDLRTLDRVLSTCRITLELICHNTYLMPNVLFVLCLLKVKYSDIYERIQAKTYTVQGLLDAIEDSLFPNYVKSNEYDDIEFAIGELIAAYNIINRTHCIDKNFKGVSKEGSDIKEYPFTVKYLKKETLNEVFDWFYKQKEDRFKIGIQYIVEKISLLNRLEDN